MSYSFVSGFHRSTLPVAVSTTLAAGPLPALFWARTSKV